LLSNTKQTSRRSESKIRRKFPYSSAVKLFTAMTKHRLMLITGTCISHFAKDCNTDLINHYRRDVLLELHINNTSNCVTEC